MLTDCFTVIVVAGTRLLVNAPFRDEKKARNFYSECLLRYPTCNVEFLPPPQDMTLGKIFILALAAFVLGIAAGILLIFILVAAAERPRRRCGNCIAFDRDLRICWYDGVHRSDRDKPCIHHNKRPKE